MVSDKNSVTKYKGLVATKELQNDERARTQSAVRRTPAAVAQKNNREAVD